MRHELPNDHVKDVVGYCNPLSVRGGGTIDFMLSSYSPGSARISVVELVSGDDRPHGTGLLEHTVATDLVQEIELTHQPLIPGSYGRVCNMPHIAEAVVEIWVYPTLLRAAPQTVLNMAGVCLQVTTEGFQLISAQVEYRLSMQPRLHRWHKVRFELSGAGMLTVESMPVGVAEQQLIASTELQQPVELSPGDWYFAATAPGEMHFNGRLEAPAVSGADGRIAAWDFSRELMTQEFADTVGAHSGQLLQNPTRGVTGMAWDGSEQNYQRAPTHYGAVHFHEDDLTDAQWAPTLSWQVPRDLPSGQYALKVEQNDSEDYVPFFVRPGPGAQRADVAYLVPTASYLAYANQRVDLAEGVFRQVRFRYANEAFLYAHKELGNSLYEYHADGSGVHFSSRLRPVLNLKPKTGTWAFNADTHITAWLHHLGQKFDVVTDEDLHLEGAHALQGYRVVITGTHPEYYSTSMYDGLAQWLSEGGRLMYMGGNGFYWRIAYQTDNPAVIEVRRAEDGTRAWIANPGEYYHQFGGEYGGLWRRLGRPPNQLVGIGFTAQGFDGGTHYRVQPGALDPRVNFILSGLSGGDTWGAFGNQGGGAAGEEIDRYDLTLGSPEHAVVIASSEDHKPGMLRVTEEVHMTQPIGADPKIRADMVFFEVPGGGAVFSTGSISYAGSLAYNHYDNEIAILTGNVLNRFIDATPFEMPAPSQSDSA